MNKIILNVFSEELRKYRVCHLHFLFVDYIYSLTRRRLKYNAVSNVNICNIHTIYTEMNDANMTEQHSRSVTSATDNELHLQCDISTIELLSYL